MTTGITPPRAYASQISMILPPFGYFQTLAEPAKADGKENGQCPKEAQAIPNSHLRIVQHVCL